MYYTVIENQQLAEWSHAAAVVRTARVCVLSHTTLGIGLFLLFPLCQKVGLTIDFLYNIYVLQFPQNENITCKNP